MKELLVKKSNGRGYGLFANKNISKLDIITEFAYQKINKKHLIQAIDKDKISIAGAFKELPHDVILHSSFRKNNIYLRLCQACFTRIDVIKICSNGFNHIFSTRLVQVIPNPNSFMPRCINIDTQLIPFMFCNQIA